MTKRLVIVAEDELGQKLARVFCDRVVGEHGAPWLRDLWVEPGMRETQRVFTGFDRTKPWSRWAEVKSIAAKRSIRIVGLGPKGEQRMAHKAVAIAASMNERPAGEPPIDALILVHDTDGDLEVATRLGAGAIGARGKRASFPVVVAAPHPESEAWVIAGAMRHPPEEASTPDKERHAQEHRRLGFDPVTQPERLSANRATDKRDAKRVCEALLGPHGDAYEAWERCFHETPLDRLEKNGERAGLRTYLHDVKQEILPLLGGR
jgi:hypothetical protein